MKSLPNTQTPKHFIEYQLNGLKTGLLLLVLFFCTISLKAQNIPVTFANKTHCVMKVVLHTCQNNQIVFDVDVNSSHTEPLYNDKPEYAEIDFPGGMLFEIVAYPDGPCSNFSISTNPSDCYNDTPGLIHYSPPGYPDQYSLWVW